MNLHVRTPYYYFECYQRKRKHNKNTYDWKCIGMSEKRQVRSWKFTATQLLTFFSPFMCPIHLCSHRPFFALFSFFMVESDKAHTSVASLRHQHQQGLPSQRPQPSRAFFPTLSLCDQEKDDSRNQFTFFLFFWTSTLHKKHFLHDHSPDNGMVSGVVHFTFFLIPVE